jgi:hypothetical protein
MSEQRKRRRQVIAGFALVVLLALFVPPFVNANLFRARLARSVSNALGRNVTMGNINIRLLPLPGFAIHDFVVMDDPSFSAEPMLRAESVTARLRLTSLWRGRLEIARLSFAYPSLNLVRNAEGHWNVEGLLSHASQVSAAPTGKRKPESRPRFPYIEADTGRINFKILQEKKAHVLVDADFALWQESENQWNMRLEARPTRTDANLGDTGTLRIEGSFQRADKIENTPIKLTFDLQRSQLGQLTTLIYGRDRGWRGDVHLTGTLGGMPRQFSLKANVQIDDFHRYDIASDDSLRITGDCVANHSLVPPAESSGFRNTLFCMVPLSPGNVEFRAYGKYWWLRPEYVSARANGVPVSALAQLYRKVKRDVPHDLTGGGLMNAYFSRISFPDADHPRWIGQGRLTNVSLSSLSLAEDFKIESVHFGFSQIEQTPEGPDAMSLALRLKSLKQSRAVGMNNVFTLDAFPASLGAAKPLLISGTNSSTGLSLQVKGDATAERLTATARLFGLRLPENGVQSAGIQNVDLNVSTPWIGFAVPQVTGSIRATVRPAVTAATETASNQQHAKTTKPARQ